MPTYHFKNAVEAHDGKLYFMFDGAMVVCLEGLLTTSISVQQNSIDVSTIGNLNKIAAGPETYEVTLCAVKGSMLPVSDMPITKDASKMSIRELFDAIQGKLSTRKKDDKPKL